MSMVLKEMGMPKDKEPKKSEMPKTGNVNTDRAIREAGVADKDFAAGGGDTKPSHDDRSHDGSKEGNTRGGGSSQSSGGKDDAGGRSDDGGSTEHGGGKGNKDGGGDRSRK